MSSHGVFRDRGLAVLCVILLLGLGCQQNTEPSADFQDSTPDAVTAMETEGSSRK